MIEIRFPIIHNCVSCGEECFRDVGNGFIEKNDYYSHEHGIICRECFLKERVNKK